MKASITLSVAVTASFLIGLFAHTVFSPASLAAAKTVNCVQTNSMMMTQSQVHSDADKALIKAMNMQHSMMGMKMTGNPDHDFLLMMIPHHQSAIDMAHVELRYGKDSRVRALATRIMSAQQKEIDEMRSWLSSFVQ
ncbi:MAG: DUF305 domain-containing protein [Candidatus Eremiobacteraeota bacterium]|nr:DUF305 domain-containing protein [Candidatus Eremiobacteraeota bacterium]